MSDWEESPVRAALCSSSFALRALPVRSYSAESSCTLWGVRGTGTGTGGGCRVLVVLLLLLLLLPSLLILSLLLLLLLLIFVVLSADPLSVEPSFKSRTILVLFCVFVSVSAMTMDGSEHDSTPRASSYLLDIVMCDMHH